MCSVSPRSVFVTGTNRGLGFETVKQLAALKDPPAIIFATYRTADSAKELFKLAESNKSVHPIQFDVRDTERYTEIVDEVSSVVGTDGLNLLIHNAAINVMATPLSVTKEQMLQTFEMNVVVPTILTKAFLPLLRRGVESGNGTPFSWSRAAVINISSIAGSISSCKESVRVVCPYAVSKAALNMATKLLSFDLRQYNVLVVAVHPGWVQTDMGGPQAPLMAPESISSVLSTLQKLTEANNGGYLNYDGTPLEY